VLRLAGEAAGDTLQQVRAKFPTSAIAVLTWTAAGRHSSWAPPG
jgi:phosphohistidine phosphatase